MKKVLFASALILCLFVSCKKNGAVENPEQEESSDVAVVEETKIQMPVEEKEPEKSDGENLSVYQKIEALGYQYEDNLKVNYRKNSSDGYSWHTREIKYDKSDRTLSKEKLMSTVWLLDDSVASSFVLLFYSDDYFMIGSRHSGPSVLGKYEIKNNEIHLYDFSYDPRVEFYGRIFSDGDFYCPLVFASSNLFFDNELHLRGIKFFPEGCYKEPGEMASVDGVDVIVKNEEKVLTENVPFRKTPDINSENQISEIYLEILHNEPNWKEREGLLKGTVITVYAKTDYPVTVDGVTSYWYYTSMPTVAEYNQYGWFFGGYFVDYDESKSAEYAEILRDPFTQSPKHLDFPRVERADFSDSSLYETHELKAFLDFDEGGFDTKVYDSPEFDNAIYTLQKGDRIHVYGYVTVLSSDKTSVEVETSKGVYGFIKIRNPYKDGNFLPERWMELDGKRVEMLRLFSSFGLNENADLRSLPTENSESVSGFTPNKYYDSTVITSDYEWVKIISGDDAAWVRVKDLYHDKGGPMIQTPEENLIWELIYSNLI